MLGWYRRTLWTGDVVCVSGPYHCRIQWHAFLEQHQDLLKVLEQLSGGKSAEKGDIGAEQISEDSFKAVKDLKEKLETEFCNAGKMWKNAVNEIWCFGPRRVGPNVLLNRVDGYNRPNVWSCLQDSSTSANVRQYDNSIVSGFQIATLAGPICEEPMRGLCYVVEEWSYIRSSESISYDSDVQKDKELIICDNSQTSKNDLSVVDNGVENLDLKDKDISRTVQFESKNDSDSESSSEEETENCIESLQENSSKSTSDKDRSKKKESPMSGQLIYCMKEGCRKAFQTQPQRLAAAMYKCSIQATSEVLG